MLEFHKMTAVQLRKGIREKVFSVEELVKRYLDRIERYDSELNTISELNPLVLEQAKEMDLREIRDLPLFGLPILVKDNFDVAGLHTTAGSLALSDNLAKRDAPVIANLRRNGALILGKTNMTEFANYTTQNMPNGYSSKGGQVRNAYDHEKDPGGSSSGSAVAVSAGFCAAAIGTDTSFSIVGCATENGVVGFKPSYGTTLNSGIVPISHTLDCAGPLARTLADAIVVYSAMREQPLAPIKPLDPKNICLGINRFGRERVSVAQLARYDVLFRRLRNAGVHFSEVTHASTPHLKSIMLHEFKRDLETYLASSSAAVKTLDKLVEYYELQPERRMKYGISVLRDALQTTGKLDELSYLQALEERNKSRKTVFADLLEYDACVMTGPTNWMHFLGLPSVALKLCMADDQTPRGIILYGADERRLLGAAMTIEQYCEDVSVPIL